MSEKPVLQPSGTAGPWPAYQCLYVIHGLTVSGSFLGFSGTTERGSGTTRPSLITSGQDVHLLDLCDVERNARPGHCGEQLDENWQ